MADRADRVGQLVDELVHGLSGEAQAARRKAAKKNPSVWLRAGDKVRPILRLDARESRLAREVRFEQGGMVQRAKAGLSARNAATLLVIFARETSEQVM